MTPEELKKWRKKQGYSQTSLARALGVRINTVHRWENGTRKGPPFLDLALKYLELKGGDKGLMRKEKQKRKEDA